MTHSPMEKADEEATDDNHPGPFGARHMVDRPLNSIGQILISEFSPGIQNWLPGGPIVRIVRISSLGIRGDFLAMRR